MNSYKILIHDKAYKKIESYFNDLKTEKPMIGAYLGQQLKNHDITSLQLAEFIQLIVRTKKTQIFAESAVHGDGTDWNLAELAILGDISIALPVKIYDNGKHFNPEVYASDFKGFLIYTPGALLRNGRGWPGNDFYIGSRATDDGVKAAATNSMAVLTGVEGKYNELTNTYDPPKKYIHWKDLVQKDKITLKIKNNILVYPS